MTLTYLWREMMNGQNPLASMLGQCWLWTVSSLPRPLSSLWLAIKADNLREIVCAGFFFSCSYLNIIYLNFSSGTPSLPTEPFFRLSLTEEYGAYLRGHPQKFPPPQYRKLFGMYPTEPRPSTYEELRIANESQDTASVIKSDAFKMAYNRLKTSKEKPDL
jgi:hypothetical protein